MAETEPDTEDAIDDRASPTHITSPVLRLEAKRAAVWVAVVGLAVLAVYISQALLVIFGAGASYDADPRNPAGTRAEYRPPLTNQLFDYRFGAAIDQSELPGIVGTVSGDDTLFVATRNASQSASLAARIKALGSTSG